jgi:hypothetical protein
VFWVSLASGHLGSFDRRKCKVLNGPMATGNHCPEGWTLYQLPGPQFRTVTDPGSAEGSYYVWVDWFDTFGLGRNVPIAMGNLNDSIYALVDGKLITLCASHIQWACSPRTSIGASMIQTPVGRARHCGRQPARGRSSTMKAARDRGRRRSRSSFVPTRSRGERIGRKHGQELLRRKLLFLVQWRVAEEYATRFPGVAQVTTGRDG